MELDMKKKFIYIILVIILLICALICLKACDKVDEKSKKAINNYAKSLRSGDVQAVLEMINIEEFKNIMNEINPKLTVEKEFIEEYLEYYFDNKEMETYKVLNIYSIKNMKDFDKIIDIDKIESIEQDIDKIFKLENIDDYKVYILEIEFDDEKSVDCVVLNNDNEIVWCKLLSLSAYAGDITLLTKAEEASDVTKMYQMKEELALAILELQAEFYTDFVRNPDVKVSTYITPYKINLMIQKQGYELYTSTKLRKSDIVTESSEFISGNTCNEFYIAPSGDSKKDYLAVKIKLTNTGANAEYGEKINETNIKEPQ